MPSSLSAQPKLISRQQRGRGKEDDRKRKGNNKHDVKFVQILLLPLLSILAP
jgi:hypothetical protein